MLQASRYSERCRASIQKEQEDLAAAAKAADDANFRPEEREFPEIPYAPLLTTEVKYVVCLDTLG